MQENKIQLSIVVPVYNVKAYLEDCVQSILEARIAQSEIILVDDGSTDGSQDICDRLQENYPESIQVIHQVNGGLSNARNKGMKIARGEYIFFMDSDDTVIPSRFRELIESAKMMNADITVGRAKYIYQNGKESDKADYCALDGIIDGRNYLEYILKYSGNNTFCAQFNVYKLHFLKKNGLTFYENIIHEDELWTPTVFLVAEKVYVTSNYFYQHYQRAGSIMTASKVKKKAQSLFLICDELEKVYSEYPNSKVRFLRNRMAMLYLKAYGLDADACNKKKRLMPIRNACKKRTLQLALLYTISPKFFCRVRGFVQLIKRG